VRNAKIETLKKYLDSEAYPWLHLVDGGISDNVGLRAYHTVFDIENNPKQPFHLFGHDNVREILIITVNAHVQQKLEWAGKQEPPSDSEVLTQSVVLQMERFSENTIQIVEDAYTNWAAAISTAELPVYFEFVEVKFDLVKNQKEREFLNKIPTNFNLDDNQVDKLISTGRRVLRNSPGFQRFLNRNQPSSR
jgi:NTE family protein